VQGFGGQARFVEENYGESALAKRFGVTRYPVLFVDDVLVAKPKDFGFYGKGEGKDEGRYTPLRSAASHDRLRADLSRVIELLLAGRRDAAAAEVRRPEVPEIAALPAFTLADLDGRPVSREDLAGRAVLVEFWATWCPPCRGTLGWLGDLRKRHGDRLVVLAPALESDESDVRRVAAGIAAPLRWAMGSPELARAFGDVSAMPTLLLFDGQGRRVASFYGAPPGLHDEVEATLEPLLK
jgi:cytochrome c biogenesis protein CcmG, thiol:disulfide interchange protein DsbE